MLKAVFSSKFLLQYLTKNFRPSPVLAPFSSTASEVELDYCHQKMNVKVAPQFAEQLNKDSSKFHENT